MCSQQSHFPVSESYESSDIPVLSWNWINIVKPSSYYTFFVLSRIFKPSLFIHIRHIDYGAAGSEVQMGLSQTRARATCIVHTYSWATVTRRTLWICFPFSFPDLIHIDATCCLLWYCFHKTSVVCLMCLHIDKELCGHTFQCFAIIKYDVSSRQHNMQMYWKEIQTTIKTLW